MTIKDGDYIPSTTAGKTWRVSTNKCSRKGLVYASAIEGVREDGCFTCEFPGSRTIRATTDQKRATAKANAQALAMLHAMMIEAEAIA